MHISVQWVALQNVYFTAGCNFIKFESHRCREPIDTFQPVLPTLQHDSALRWHSCSQITGVTQKRSWQLPRCPGWESKLVPQASHSPGPGLILPPHPTPHLLLPSLHELCLDICACLMSHSLPYLVNSYLIFEDTPHRTPCRVSSCSPISVVFTVFCSLLCYNSPCLFFTVAQLWAHWGQQWCLPYLTASGTWKGALHIYKVLGRYLWNKFVNGDGHLQCSHC